MEKYYALLKKNIVIHIIIADESFLSQVEKDYDQIIDITKMNRPHIGDHYLSESNDFLSNHKKTIELPYNLSDDHLHTGTEEGFEPFILSKYSVKYEKGYVTIGCKKYSAPGLMDALHKTLVENKDQAACFIADEKGPTDGKFNITWEDAEKLYNALSRVRFL